MIVLCSDIGAIKVYPWYPRKLAAGVHVSQARVRETFGSTAAGVLFEFLLRITLPAVGQRSKFEECNGK